MKQGFNCFRAHAGFEIILIFFTHIQILFFGENLHFGQFRVAGVGDNVFCEIQHLFKVTRRNVQNQAHSRRDTLEIPNVGNRRDELNVAHSFAADFGFGDFNAAAFANLAFIANALIFAAVAFPVFLRPENAFAEQAVALGF